MTNTRAIAVTILLKVLVEGYHYQPALCRQVAPHLSEKDTSFVNNLCFGVLRFYPRLMAFEKRLLQSPLKQKDNDLAILILVGLFQLFYLDTPEYAVLHDTVDAVKVLKKVWAKKLINGVLRSAIQQKEQLLALPDPTIQSAHPKWLLKALKTAWPEHWQQIIDANLTHPPFSLRVNTRQMTLPEFHEALKAAGIAFEPIPFCPTGLILSPAKDVSSLPGFATGAFTVQDGAAQLAAPLLDLKANQRILDACAAPGGKTAHMIDCLPDKATILALDQDPKRLKRLMDNLDRLSGKATVQCADASDPEAWWDGQPFDRILCDAPCSATGVIRRHPDIKIHRQPTDIPELIAQQQKLLTKIWPLLKPGGILLYATCSILPAENSEQMKWFTAKYEDAIEWPIEADWGLKQVIGRQILPGEHKMDGFYYARIRKAG